MRALRLISNGVVPSSSEQSPSPRQRSFPLSSRASQGEKMCARRWRGFADPGSVDDFGSSGTASFVVTESSSPGFAVGAATLCVELEAGWHPMLSGRAIAATERKERGIVENSISRLAHGPGSREGGLRAVGVSAPLSFLGCPFLHSPLWRGWGSWHCAVNLKYPTAAFSSPEHATEWVESFVDWYNTRHLHSAVGFVSPTQRHEGRDSAILAQRRVVYEAARRRNPRRWSRETRNWSAPATVILNPTKQTKVSQTLAAHAA